MATIRFLPENKTINFELGISILDLALENNIYIPSQCEEGTCSTCMVKVEYGKKLILESNKEFNTDSGNILSCISKLKEKTKEEIIIYISE